MAMTRLHGQSDYTPTKQEHLRGILTYCSMAWNLRNKPWAHDELVVIDCTAGAGHDEQGNPGSPLIFHDYLSRMNDGRFRLLCCEADTKRADKLRQTTLGSDARVTIANTPFQDTIESWLNGLRLHKRRSKVLGWVYCDPNGAQGLIGNYDVFNRLSVEWRALDFVFHFSLTAYNRNRGVGAEWAQDDVIDQCDRLRSLKGYAKARLPKDKWRWVMFHLLNTPRIDGRWNGEDIYEYDTWRSLAFLPRGAPSPVLKPALFA